ncbi:MAG: NUDIX domain-containing protein [Phycisphaerales bacterium]
MPPETRSSAESTSPEPGGSEEISRRTIHKGRKFDFEMVNVRRRDGKTIEREVVRHPGAVLIVPILADGRVVVIRNYRVAVGVRLVEFPAGTLEHGEDPASCAARELIEETGYKAATLAPLGWFHTTPGLTDEKMYAFAALGLEHVGQHLEEDEDIQVEQISGAEALAMLGTGSASRLGTWRDGKSMVAVILAQRAGYLK